MNRITTVLTALMVFGIGSINAGAHCQIPCGIYDDNLRFNLMAEHIATIEKAMQEINKLSAAQAVNYNQLSRWIENKDIHAGYLSELVTYYFMTQRVVPVEKSSMENYEKYVREITFLHQILYHAMKAKQTTDLGEINKLRELLKQFQASYLAKEPAK